jgi:hypothetical protein
LEILKAITELDKVIQGLSLGINNLILDLEVGINIKGDLGIKIQRADIGENRVTGNILQMGQEKSHMINTGGGVPVIIGAIQIMIGGALANLEDTPIMTKGTQNMTGGALMIKNRTLGEALQEEIDMKTNQGLAAD